MRKCAVVLLALILCLAAGCSAPQKSEENTEWIEAGASLLGDDIRSGEFVLNGKVYSFPMPMSVWIDNGWHVSENYANKDAFKLGAYAVSTRFELFNDDGGYVSVCAYNGTQEYRGVEECMVYRLSILMPYLQAVLPGGLNCASMPDDVVKAYGRPDYTEDSNGAFFQPYYDFVKDGYACSAMLQIEQNARNGKPFARVVYMAGQGEMASDLDEDAVNEKSCARYVNAAMETAYRGNSDEYTAMGIAAGAEAAELYESEVYRYADILMECAGIAMEEVDDSTVSGFDEVAGQVLRQAKWEVAKVELDNHTLTGTLQIRLYPLDFIGSVKAAADALKEMEGTETERAERLLEILREKATEAGNGSAVTKKYPIDCADGIISDEVWVEIDDIIMGFRD